MKHGRAAALIAVMLALAGCNDFIRMEGHDPWSEKTPTPLPDGEVAVTMQSSMAAPCTLQIRTAQGDVRKQGAPPPATGKKTDPAARFALPADREAALAALKPLAARDMAVSLIADSKRPSQVCIDAANRLAVDAGFGRFGYFY